MITMKTSKLKFTTMMRTTLLMPVKRPSKASRNFAKPVSIKIANTEPMQKTIHSIEGTKRQYREVLHAQ